LWGHEALISSISRQRGSPLFNTDNEILVWLELPKSAYAVSRFGISLPVKDYDKDLFLGAVIKEGYNELQSIVMRH